MTVELAPAPAPVIDQPPKADVSVLNGVEEGLNGGQAVANGDSNGQAQQVVPDLELHRACAEGQLDEVRAVLSKGLEQLEALDMSTGCTPIVLAIRANHVEVVRELLTAGAIVPPPGLTNDPTMLSLLYPQPMYGLPPQFMGAGHHQPMSMPAEFYPQQGFYPDPRLAQQQQQQQQANLPPAEVAKTIPCRNFPNCKYGSSCVFFHPRGQPGFFGNGSASGPTGYEQGYPTQGYQQMPYFGGAPQPNGFQPQQFQQPSQPITQDRPVTNDTQHQNGYPQQHQHGYPQQNQQQQQQQTQQSALASTSETPAPIPENDTNVAPAYNDITQAPLPPHELSAAPASFVPFGMTSPTQPQFGMSPMSPPMMPMSPHDAAAFYASSPPNGMMVPPPQAMNGGFVPRRQSINQGPGGYLGSKPYGHGKKPSFSGGPRPWAGAGRASGGGWKDGNPPPCAFFAQGKCRNGEFCKFPHIDAEGADCRHPDVIRGIIAPAPPLPRGSGPRPMRMSNNFGQFDPNRQFVPRPQPNAANVSDEATNGHLATPVEVVGAESASATAPVDADSAAPAQVQSAVEAQPKEVTSAPKQTAAAVPAPSVAATQQSLAPNTSGIARSASQPGVQRFQPNGFHSRSHSPSPSNVSFHGNGHPRRGGRPFNAGMHNGGNGAGARSVSAGENKQRVPSADDFPALGGASGNTSPQERSTATFSKTAAQVLSAPAPPKPETPKQEAPAASEDGVTMDDESESDAVIITMTKPSSPAPAPASASAEQTTESKTAVVDEPKKTPTTAPAASEPKRGPISFASVASSVASAAAGISGSSAPAAASSPAIESAPVALKA